jgi:S-adenosylmethionine-diacylgycerolhomoserine-N-methlytransferase
MTQAPTDHAQLMDRVYRYTRHLYDASRKYYLLGRDSLLRDMAEVIRPDDHVLEMGCGTARNLIKLHRLAPQARLFGLDASQAMLETAERSIQRRRLGASITLRHCLAEQVDHRQTFDLPQPFDLLFFSYSLSMMPTWDQAIDAGLANLKPGGRMYVVDFYDQADLPRFFSRGLKWWLKQFHVTHRPELLERLEALAEAGRIELSLKPIARRYAYQALCIKPQ